MWQVATWWNGIGPAPITVRQVDPLFSLDPESLPLLKRLVPCAWGEPGVIEPTIGPGVAGWGLAGSKYFFESRLNPTNGEELSTTGRLQLLVTEVLNPLLDRLEFGLQGLTQLLRRPMLMFRLIYHVAFLSFRTRGFSLRLRRLSSSQMGHFCLLWFAIGPDQFGRVIVQC